MNEKTLTKYEKEIVDDFIIRNHDHFSVAVFNHAISYTLPTWRGEMLIGDENKKTLAYVDYVKEILRIKNKV